LICFDVEKGKEAMNMATTFFSFFACSIYANNRRSFDMLSSKIKAMSVLREATVEIMTLLGW
jgi:hypothetical protein